MRKPELTAIADPQIFSRQVWNLWGILEPRIDIFTASSSIDAVQVCKIDATSALVALTLPLASAHPGRVYIVWKSDATANIARLTAAAGDTIQGIASLDHASQYDSSVIISDGLNTWIRLS